MLLEQPPQAQSYDKWPVTHIFTLAKLFLHFILLFAISSSSHPFDADFVYLPSYQSWSNHYFYVVSSIVLIMVIANPYWMSPLFQALCQDLKLILIASFCGTYNHYPHFKDEMGGRN